MKFSIELTRVQFHARHGVFDQENRVGNTFIVDFSGSYDVSDDWCSDHLDDTISYADIYGIIAAEMNTPSALLEHVAARIIQTVRRTFPAFHCATVRIEKVRPPIAGLDGNAAVSLQWSRQTAKGASLCAAINQSVNN